MSIFDRLKKQLSFGNTTNTPVRERLLPLPQVAPTGGSQEVTDIAPAWWFGPLHPVKPMAPESFRIRQWAYPSSANLLWQPKVGEVVPGVTFETLRALADAYDILRLVIETRKDQLAAIPWTFRAKKKVGETPSDYKTRSESDKKLVELGKFFERPDGVHDFKKWMRMWLEDMLVVDAVALYMQRDKQGRVASVLPVDGATIARWLTEQGLTPPPPQPAYAQVLYGVPAANLTTDELVYSMRNERTCRRYGYSRVEQVLLTINLGLRRKDWQIQEYTSGNTPEAMVFLPSDMPIDRVQEVQEWFDSVLSGQTAARKRIRFLPGYGTGANNARPNVVFPKAALLKDPIDEWLAQVICYAFSLSPQAFMRMMNRATAQSAQESSEEEGIEPDKQEVIAVVNSVLDRLGYGTDYECVAEERREPDAAKQAAIDVQYCPKIKTINEVREERGLEPYNDPNADKLGTWGANGFIPIETPPQPAAGPMGAGAPMGAEGEEAAPAGAEDADAAAASATDAKLPAKQPANGNGQAKPETGAKESGSVTETGPRSRLPRPAPVKQPPQQPAQETGSGKAKEKEPKKEPEEVKQLKEKILKLLGGNGHDQSAAVTLVGKTNGNGHRNGHHVEFDDMNGIGAEDAPVRRPDFVRDMTPDEYLNVCLPVIGRKDTSGDIEEAIRDGQSIARPTLDVQWDDIHKKWQVVGHDGRHRAIAVRSIDPETKIPVRVFVNA